MQITPTAAAHPLERDQVWDTTLAADQLVETGVVRTRKSAERRLHQDGLLPAELKPEDLRDAEGRPATLLLVEAAIATARRQRQRVLFVQLHTAPGSATPCLHANDARGARYWVPLRGAPELAPVLEALERLQAHIANELSVFPHGPLVPLLRRAPSSETLSFAPWAYHPVLTPTPARPPARGLSAHLRRLEAESIHIIREAVAESENPVMLYSIGKDSGVMLHLAQKAFAPGRPPFPLLHVDTRWKFREMYLFRQHVARETGMELIVHINPEAIERDINPFDHGSALHTHITKTEGLKQALDARRFDVIFGGARRDEEKSRAKERVFSFRTATHQWDPKNQRPELWDLYNARRGPGESIRVFPLSNWTELDVWQYILEEEIPVVPLYFAEERPVVSRNGTLLMVDDDRFRLMPGEEIALRPVRFRTLGCYPLTGAIESTAKSIEDIVLELVGARSSERQGRVIDSDASASMEKKKQEGYF
jgi:sulfate adenylyltransferase subunit 2